MGIIDTAGKKYFSDNSIFADVFNYLLHDGKQVIKPESLRELDTTEIIVPYGNESILPVKKVRDLLKLWSVMTDDEIVYVMLGAELQSSTHYAMPVKKCLYDMLSYASQVEEARKSYKKDIDKTSDKSYHSDSRKIKLSSPEFLSGFRKGDKLVPIITVTILLSEDEWDGPHNLHDMFESKYKDLLKYIPDCPINLISPANMDESDFDKFNTELGFALNVLKNQKSGLAEVIKATNHSKITIDTANFLNITAKLDLEYEQNEEMVDMCKAMEDYTLQQKVIGSIETMRELGTSDDKIISIVKKLFGVSDDYVLALLTPQTA